MSTYETDTKETDVTTEDSTTTSTEEFDYVNYQSVPTYDNSCETVEMEEPPAEPESCPTCIPNPKAPAIDWTKRDDTKPFLNERKCTYSISLRTQYEGSGGPGSSLQERLDEYVDEGVKKLLAHYNKALDVNTVAAMNSVAGATDHYIPPRARLKMKVLIEIPANDFDKMPSAQEIKEDSTLEPAAPDLSDSLEDLGVSASDAATTYTAHLELEGLEESMKQVHHGLEAYARFQVIYLKTQRGLVLFPGGQMVNLLDEAKHFKKVYPGLSNFLTEKGFVLRETRGNNTLGKMPGSPKLINKIDINFDNDYKIVKIILYQHGTCEEAPIEIEGLRLHSLQNTYPFDRPTTMAFLGEIENMKNDLRRREGMMPWTEFVELYVKPKPIIDSGIDLKSTVSAFAAAATGHATDKDMEVLAKTAVTMTDADRIAAQTPGSWGGAPDAYQDYKKRSSQDDYKGSALDQSLGREPVKKADGTTDWEATYDEMIDRKTLSTGEMTEMACNMDDLSGIGDALSDWGENFMQGLNDELFSIFDAVAYQFQNYLCMSPEDRAKLLENLQNMNNQAMAEMLAETIALIFGFLEMIESFQESMDEIKDIKGLWTGAFDEIKLCGLFDLMLAFIECLAMGLDLEEMLEPLLAAALKNMDVSNFHKMFVGLPADAQRSVMQKVEAEMGSHMLPWDAAKIQGKPDPSAETGFGNKPSAGTVVSWGGPGTPLSKEKAASRSDPNSIAAKYIGVARKLESEANKAREESVYYTDPDENGDTEKLYGLTEAAALALVAGTMTTLHSDLDSYAEAYEAAGDYPELAKQLIAQANGSDTVAIEEVDLGPLGTVDGKEKESSITQTVEYQTRYEQMIEELCRANYDIDRASREIDGDDTPMESYKDYKVGCRERPDIQEAAASVAEAFAEGAADDGTIGSNGPYGTRGSLGAALGSSVTTLLSAYAQALLDHYVVAGLEDLKKAIMERPGAAFVAKMIAAIDCIVPPLFDPPLFDFLNTLEIDFCNNQYGIVLPRLGAIQLPNWKDFFKYLLDYLIQILLYIIFRIMLYILTKIIFMLFDSLCKALQKLGEAASQALADAACNAMEEAGGFLGDVAAEAESAGSCETPPRSLKDLIREGFCGPDASDAKVDQTTRELMRGVGGVTEADAARMANPDSVNQLVADISTVLTGDELTDLLLGNPNPGAVQMIREVVQTENPDFASALGSTGQVRDMFKNLGNMMPPEFKAKLREDISVPQGIRPANPNLCTTQDDIKRFRDLRNTILMAKDGTTLDQANQQFDAFRGRALNDLAEIGDILQGGVENFVASNLPPILGGPDPSLPSDGPPCDDSDGSPEALIPRDPKELKDLMEAATDGLYDAVDQSFELDLMGRKGMLNMILSDTYGVPYSRHDRKSDRSIYYSDYKGQLASDFDIDAGDISGTFWEYLVAREKGEYPTYIAQYLRDYLNDNKHLGDGYESTSDYTYDENIVFDATIPGATPLEGFQGPIDDTGTLVGTEENPFVIAGGKDPDLTLTFRDNNKGVEMGYLTEDYQFSEGFNLEYQSYIISEDAEGTKITNTNNVYNLKIVEISNEYATLPRRASKLKLDSDDKPDYHEVGDEVETEDVVIDVNILGELSDAAEELRSEYDFTKNADASPQNNVWSQFLVSKFANLGLSEDEQQLFESDTIFSSTNANQTYDNIANTLLEYMGRNIAANESAYLFGFTAGADDDLAPQDKAYMSPDGTMLFSQWAAKVLAPSLGEEYLRRNGKPRWKKLKKYIKANQIMGTSRHSRLEFLNPAQFGGSWLAPPYYITPPVYEGWLGIKDAVLPEIDGKEPKRTSIANFKDIKERVDDLTNKMPDDPRLSECPDCVVELPYSRILDRAAAGGMEGPILSLIRVYVTEEFLKAMPVFSNFKALIPEVMDYTYVEYIIQKMEIDFKENLGRKRGFLKGDALWYTFLEQCVQSYGRRIQLDGLEPPASVQSALESLNAIQKDFKYPTEEELMGAKMKAGHNPWGEYGVETTTLEPEVVFGRKVEISTKLAWYRRWHLLQAVKDTEMSARVILRELVEEQLEYMADQFSNALEEVNLKPEVTDIHKYFIGSGDFVAGRQSFSPDLDNYNGGGDVLNVASGLDSNPLNGYQSSEWEPLTVDVQIGDGGEGSLATIDGFKSRLTTGEFILEKYVRVEDKSELGISHDLPEVIIERSDSLRGVVNIDTWKTFLGSALMQEHQDSKLSDFFGDLEFTYAFDEEGNPIGEPTGIVGSTGVKYGLRISYIPPEEMADDLEECLAQLQESENWPSIQRQAELEKAYFLSSPTFNMANGSMNVGEVNTYDRTTGNKVTEASSYAQSLIDSLDTAIGLESEGGTGSYSSYKPRAAKFVIPIAHVEYDALDYTLSGHVENIENELDVACLAQDLINTPEFELIFRYVFPLNRITSLMSIYVGRAFLMSIGEKVMSTSESKLHKLVKDGYPATDPTTGEWQVYNLRLVNGRSGPSYDRWDSEFLFKKTKRNLVKMFRTYFKSREFLANGDDDADGQGDFNNNEKRKNRKKKGGRNKDKGMKRGFRKQRRRERSRPYDKNGN
jgi:hypothetical protein